MASAQCLAFALYLEEAKEAICEGCDHVGLELVHGDGNAFLFRDNELNDKLTVIHVPELDDTVLAT